jgi:hypothetical protein
MKMDEAKRDKMLQSDLVMFSQKYQTYTARMASAKDNHELLLARNTAHRAKQAIKEVLFQIYEKDLKKNLEVPSCPPTQN